MNNVALFKYITGNSKIHKMSSKYKIAWLLLTIIQLIMLNDPISSLLIGIFVIYLIHETKIDIKKYLYDVLFIWPLYLFAFIITFIISGDAYVGLLVLYKVMVFMIAFLILTFTTSLSEIAWGFECLFSKLKKIKVPVSKIALNIALSIKFISTMFEQWKSIRKSMAYRGVPYNKKQHKTVKNILIPVISLSFKLSKRMIAAMRLRFYGYATTRTNYRGNKVTKFDKVLIFIQIVMLYLVVWLGWFK